MCRLHGTEKLTIRANRGGMTHPEGTPRFSNEPAKDIMQDNRNEAAPSTVDLEIEVAKLIVEGLNLDIAPDQIAPEAPLYGEGLGLDSIDVLEIALVVSKRYGFQLRADSADNRQIFSSLRSLSEYIAAHRTR